MFFFIFPMYSKRKTAHLLVIWSCRWLVWWFCGHRWTLVDPDNQCRISASKGCYFLLESYICRHRSKYFRSCTWSQFFAEWWRRNQKSRATASNKESNSEMIKVINWKRWNKFLRSTPRKSLGDQQHHTCPSVAEDTEILIVHIVSKFASWKHLETLQSSATTLLGARGLDTHA